MILETKHTNSKSLKANIKLKSDLKTKIWISSAKCLFQWLLNDITLETEATCRPYKILAKWTETSTSYGESLANGREPLLYNLLEFMKTTCLGCVHNFYYKDITFSQF